MNKFDKAFNNHMETVYASMCLNEYIEDEDEEGSEEESALAAANAAAATPEEHQTSDQKSLAKSANKFNRQAANTLSKSTSALKKKSF
tara:strand:+ start:4235 stop:4498 length:264 start_codon:yes stop_codon:yes gene_type:complete